MVIQHGMARGPRANNPVSYCPFIEKKILARLHYKVTQKQARVHVGGNKYEMIIIYNTVSLDEVFIEYYERICSF